MEIARYIIDNKATVRQAAKKYGISKSTVHKDRETKTDQSGTGSKDESCAGCQQIRTAHSWGNGDQRKIFASTSYLEGEKAGIVSAFFCIVLY